MTVKTAARLFDEGHFFEAHEVWEERWRLEMDPAKRLHLQGLIQIAAAFHKLLDKGSPEAAARLFEKGLTKLDASAAAVETAGELAAFREGVRACAKALSEGSFDRAAIPRCVRS